MNKERLYKIVDKYKKCISKEYRKGNYNNVLHLIESCANYLYTTNLRYMDCELEDYINRIANLIGRREWKPKYENTVVFYDNFGFDMRGLAKIYISALLDNYRVVYVSRKKFENRIPTIKRLLLENSGELIFIDDYNEDYISMIKEMNNIMERIAPRKLLFYSTPDDVCGVSLLSLVNDNTEIVQIDLTDHAFWLGARWINRCIEFREYGASVAKEYRDIDENIISVLPYYPIIDRDCEFEGFPFLKEANDKVIFSGGSLYKTIGDDNKYYKIVEYILNSNNDTIFWYAGGGNEKQIKKIKKKYPNRVYLTKERKDLFQIMERCYFYLSTYPIMGGLMTQFAAEAGKIPLTLRFASSSDGVLLNQKKLGFEFDSIDDLFAEIDCLLNNKDYMLSKQSNMSGHVITPEEFSKKLHFILENKIDLDRYSHIETEKLQELYIENSSIASIAECIARREFLRMGLKYFPLYTTLGIFHRIQIKLKNKL